jgi:hypothetical protein
MKNLFFVLCFFVIFAVTGKAQDTLIFKTPDAVPENVIKFTEKLMDAMKDSGNGVMASFMVANDNIYRIEFMNDNSVVYFDSKKSTIYNYTIIEKTGSKSPGTKEIKLGWFQDLYNFGGDWEQPKHVIRLATTSAYFERNNKGVMWGYSSHHFEDDPWKDCYGSYMHTTQTVTLSVFDINLNTGLHHVFSNYEPSYSGVKYQLSNNQNTDINVDNYANQYEILFRIDFTPPTLTGKSVLCTNEQTTFTLNNTTNSTNVVWSFTGNVAYVSGQGTNNFTVRANGSGAGTVTATIIGNPDNTILTKSFWIGNPSFSLEGEQILGTDMVGIASLKDPHGGISSVKWTKTGAIQSITGSVATAKYIAGMNPGTGEIFALASNACGSLENHLLITVTGSLVNIYPNPTTDILNIEFIPNKNSDVSSEIQSENTETEIKLYDKNMNILICRKSTDNSVSLNLQSLKADIYTISILKNGKIYTDKIIKTE